MTNSKISASTTHNLEVRKAFPHFIKYMGSKSSLIENLATAIDSIYTGEYICDLFAGSSTLSGALGGSAKIISNDIQEYSSILAKTYLGNYSDINLEVELENILSLARVKVDKFISTHPNFKFSYSEIAGLEEFKKIELDQQKLIDYEFGNVDFHLFTKYYSGTYWSFDQCIWIDAIREVAESYKNTKIYSAILSSLMFAMAYNAQSTGHYAQYRDATNVKSMNDIFIYRRKEIIPYFSKKLLEIGRWNAISKEGCITMTSDYESCIENLPLRTIIYADPPYAFVHYSRFYHAIETLVKYDYPEVMFKGRYRIDRHQSPFCKRTEVEGAFKRLFDKAALKECKIVLSYSNTGMISLEKIIELANESYGSKYDVSFSAIDYTHSTMGRKKDKSREVKEYLVIVKPL